MNQYLCNEKCWKKLACGHPCQEKCGSPCTVSCKFPVKQSQPCGHEIIIECFQEENVNQYLCKEKCLKKLAHVHIQVTTAIAMNGAAGTVSTLSVAGNVQRNVTDLHAMSLVTRNCVVVTGVLDSVERDA
jgi:hypothetical protein